MVDPLIRRTVRLVAPVAEVWSLLTDPDELREWLGMGVDLPAIPGAAGAVVDDDGTSRALVVDVVEREHRLGFTWWPVGSRETASTVVFTLDEDEEGTSLTVTEAPVARAGGMRCQLGVLADGGADPWTARLLGLELAVLTRVGISA